MPSPVAAFLLSALTIAVPPDDTIWVEGESAARARVVRHPWYGGQVKASELSGGAFLSHWGDAPGLASYRVEAPSAGPRTLWVRANPVQATLEARVNGGPWAAIDTKGAEQSVNIASDGKPDLRFLAWIKAGRVELKRGPNTIEYRFASANNHHGSIDCFVLADDSFRPRGLRKPGESAASAEPGWFAFDPPADPFDASAGFDLRRLNEAVAGQDGRIDVKGDDFVHPKTGRPVRFWAVNGMGANDPEGLRREARTLAKHGVNLVRLHGAIFDAKTGTFDPASLDRARMVVEALKREGIYTHLSVYFPLWLTPGPDSPFLAGYDGTKHPFATLYFDEKFQKQYRDWLARFLTTPDPAGGARLIDDPAVFGIELVNEDSYFFWTFSEQNLPEPELKLLESRFGVWAAKKYGSIDKALAAWTGARLARDNPAEGRLAFRPLWNIAHEKTPRDRDTARFLYESQRGFYDRTSEFLRSSLGFEGLITASNWTTADAAVLGPLEKMSYAGTDFLDRHGYFSDLARGENSAWSIRDGHTFADRSALRFDPEQPGKPKEFANPAADPQYAGKPSMISETTFNRPNRYRSEAPLYFAAYGALQDSDAIVHFAQDGPTWAVKPRFFMQPWTLMTPAMMGQFPAAALIYREGLVEPGEVLVDLDLNREALLNLAGSPLHQAAALDDLRRRDVGRGGGHQPAAIDPLVHFAGRVTVDFVDGPGRARVDELSRFIDRKAQVVLASNGQLRLDYGKGVLAIDAPMAQGLSGNLKAAGATKLAVVEVDSPMELGHVVAVALDGQPLATSKEILLQVMSEEKATGFRADPQPDGTRRIASIGEDPWLVREIAGNVRIRRTDASTLKVTPLDANGMPSGKPTAGAGEIRLNPRTIYYRIAP